jgi:hypothetical protein
MKPHQGRKVAAGRLAHEDVAINVNLVGTKDAREIDTAPRHGLKAVSELFVDPRLWREPVVVGYEVETTLPECRRHPG